MSSPLLALFVQSLSQDCYGKATYWTRGGLCGLTALFLFMIVAELRGAGAPGLNCFIVVTVLQMMAISLIGLTYFGSAVAEEKEEETLGLLRMTDLNPLSILLGKSTSRLCGALLLLVTALPFTIVAVTLGGVSLHQIAATYCTITTYTFLVCNVALLGSVLARNTARAAIFTAMVIGVLLGTGPALVALTEDWTTGSLPPVAKTLSHVTPIGRLTAILGTHYTGPLATWPEAGCVVLGLASFLLAWAVFNRFCDRGQDAPASRAGTPVRVLWWRIPRPSRPRRFAIAWKDYHFLFGGHAGLIIRLLVYLVLPAVTLGLMKVNRNPNLSDALSHFVNWLAIFYFIDIGAMGARLFRHELNEQTLSSLAILPSTIRRVAWRKALVLALVAVPGTVSSVGLSLLQQRLYGGSSFSRTALIVQAGNIVVSTALYLHWVVFASLLVKRGGLPLGIVATAIFSILMSFVVEWLQRSSGFRFRGTSATSYMTFFFIVTAAISLICIVFLHFRSLRRLEALSAEG